MQVISVPGNKTLIVTALVSCMAIALMLGAMLSQRQREVKLYEKKLEKRISAIDERNRREVDFENLNISEVSKRK